MCKYFYSFKILFLTCAILDISFQLDEDYVSLESGEITEINEINEVIDSASKEDFDKLNRRVAPKEETERRVNIDKSIELVNSTMKAQVNVSSFNCEGKKESSSEESQCKSTLINYPFSVSIQKKGAHYASGALVGRQHVLTVAEEFFKVRLGSVDCKRGGVVLPVKLVDIHPFFNQGLPSYDVALLTLSKTVDSSEYIKPIPLSKVEQGVLSAMFLTTYWPRLIVNGALLPKTAKERLKHHNMRVSTQKLIPWSACATLMKAREAVLDETSLCLKPIATHHSSCLPDVGAPVVADDGLWGITSGWISESCEKYPSPTIFTRTNLKPIRSWLESLIEDKTR